MNNLLLIFLLLFSVTTASAPDNQADKSIREIVENEQAVEAALEKIGNGKNLDMSSPLSSLLLLKQALDNEDYDKAGEFLDMRYLPRELEGISANTLLQQLRYVWSRQELLNIASVSDQPAGHDNDGLPGYRDQIGSIQLSSATIPVYMQRVPDGKGGQIWKISNATVAHIPEMWEELGYHPIAKYLADTLPTFRLLGMENWQAFLLGLSLLLAWPLATLICVLLTRVIVTRSGPFMDAIANFLKLQFRIFLYFILVRAVFEIIGLSLYSKALLQSAGFTYIAVIILLFGITNLLLGYQARRLLQAGNEHYVALLKPASTVIKVLLCIAMVLVWAENAGYSMSTLLAGLGVGSLAVALAAQKTLENIIGAITIYSARPIKPGDFCRFGTTVGTVEEIGLRSTMLRTLNRTLVSIPNSIFAGEEVENYSERDRIRYFRYLRLEIGSPDQLRSLLSELRKLFSSRKMLQADTISIRFDEITDNTAHVRVDAGVMTNDFQTYLEEAEELNLHILELVHNAGINFSGPGQQLTLRSGGTQTAPDPDALERFLASQQTSPAGSGD